MNGLPQQAILITIGVVACAGIIGASFSNAGTVNILGFCSLICVSLLGLLQGTKQTEKLEVLATGVTKAAERVEEVKQDLAAGDKTTAKVLSDIHTLVNSAMGAQLKATAEALKELYELKPTKEKKEALDIAQKLLAEHEVKQGKVDQGRSF